MRKDEQDQMGFKEFFSIIFFTTGSKSADMSTVFLFREGLNAAWIIVIGSFLLTIPSLLLLNYVLKKYKSKHILEVAELTLGRPIAFVIAFIILFFTTLNTATDSRSYMTQLITINFPNTPLFILCLLFLFLCMWGAKKGWEVVGSIAWTAFPYVLLGLGLLMFLMYREATFNRMFPLFGTGQWEIAKASFRYTSLYLDPFVFAIMYPYVKNHKTYTRSLYSSLIFVALLMALMYLSYVWVFDYRSIERITFPLNEAIRIVTLGRTITNIDTFFITFWLIGVFVKFIVYIYVIGKIFGYLFSIKEFEHALMPITLLILIIALIPESNEVNMFAIRKNTIVYFKYLLLSLPLLLWIMTKIKERRTT
ncbi:endospore germination permease [Niallia sp. XMNu-256]|uniref:GerAB/ArcD/ProY family transporter n=1 Tax=Niallia sp. XMNu-256 TaxID=3082444 RepID=UPI0030CDD8EA